MSDLTLVLGGIAFQGFEIPEQITGLGGEQMLNVHTLPGGVRTIDSMGRDDAPIHWSGRFRGSDALGRARAVDALRQAGGSVDLSFGDVFETVVIRRFSYDFERFYEVPYSITLEVLVDQTVASDEGPTVDDMITGDDATLDGLGTDIGDAGFSGAMSSLDSAIGQVPSFASASQAEIATVLAPVRAAQTQVSGLISTGDDLLTGASLSLPGQTALGDLLGGRLP